MKKVAVFIFIVTILFMTSTAHADNALRKLGRGFANIITCPIEIPYRIGEANQESGPLSAMTWGVLDGFYRTGARLVVGAYEVVTFPIPFPRHYEPVIDDPEFFLEEGLF